MQLLSILIRVIAVGVLVCLAIVDVRNRRLPNLAVAVVGTLFFVDAALTGMPVEVLCTHLAVAAIVLCAGFALFLARMLGGGDAKLAAVIFLWTGSSLLLPTITIVSIVGTLVSLVSLATYRLDPASHRGPLGVLALFSGTRGVPYGVALSTGGSIVILAPALTAYVSAH